jgi:putative transposase
MSQGRFGRSPGGLSSVGLHLVWCPEYGLGILGGRVAGRCGELVEQIATERHWQIVAKEVLPDHLHLFGRVRVADAPAQVVRALKGRTARVLRAEFACLRRQAGVLWSPSCFAALVGCVSESAVRRYIEHRWEAVMAW